MRHSPKVLASAVTATGLLAGCALGQQPPSEVGPGSLAQAGDLSDVQITVGGKEFTEQLVLCELTAQALESAGADVERSCGMSGTATVREALNGGGVDLYWEYTGTGWVTHLGETEPIDDPQELHRQVAERDERDNSVAWLDPAPADNTYAVATTQDKARELGVQTLSDYADVANQNPSDASFCGAAEFFGRDDGWPGLQEEYGFELGGNHVSELAAGAIYNSIDQSDPCTFGEVFATDGRIAALDLAVLEDDRDFFIAYNPAATVRKEALDEHPAIADVLAPVSEALTDDVLQSLNADVDFHGAAPEQAAKDWLIEEGFASAK